jgi:hypothetical protein
MDMCYTSIKNCNDTIQKKNYADPPSSSYTYLLHTPLNGADKKSMFRAPFNVPDGQGPWLCNQQNPETNTLNFTVRATIVQTMQTKTGQGASTTVVIIY